MVARAGRSGLDVTCRFEGDREQVPEPVAHLAFRVVQESLTNALRYAPGAEVRIVIIVEEAERGLAVRVENGSADEVDHARSPGPGAAWSGCASASTRSVASSVPGRPVSVGGSWRPGCPRVRAGTATRWHRPGGSSRAVDLECFDLAAAQALVDLRERVAERDLGGPAPAVGTVDEEGARSTPGPSSQTGSMPSAPVTVS